MAGSVPISRAALGRRSRNKGKSFELVVRDHLRRGAPGLETLTVRRSSQAERAWDADLIIEGSNAPRWMLELWVECEHANDPDPRKKFAQATRDAKLAYARSGRFRTPVVIWRKTASRSVWFSTDVQSMFSLLHGGDPSSIHSGRGILVTMLLEDLLSALAGRA